MVLASAVSPPVGEVDPGACQASCWEGRCPPPGSGSGSCLSAGLCQRVCLEAAVGSGRHSAACLSVSRPVSPPLVGSAEVSQHWSLRAAGGQAQG